MTDAELTYRAGALFDRNITDVFWDSFKGELGRAQADVLVYLYSHEGARASEIAEDLNISKQHVSKIISGFTSDGFVIDRTDERDKRAVSLALSRAGKEYLGQHFAASERSLQSLMEKMDDEEKKRFRSAMETIAELLPAD